MKTNYNNLTPFETCIVVIAIIGLGLIGYEVYTSMPKHEQAEVQSSVSMFDLQQQFSQVRDGTNFAMDSMGQFYADFDVAFGQIFSYPDQIGAPVEKFAANLSDYSTTIADNYSQNIQDSQNYSAGQILGAMVVNESNANSTTPASTTNFEKAELMAKQYYYHAPGIVSKILK